MSRRSTPTSPSTRTDPPNRRQSTGCRGDAASPRYAPERSLELQPVKLRRRPREQRGLLRFAVRRGQPLEGVEDHLIAALAFIRRKIALEHASVRPEGLDAGFDVGTPCGRGFLR